jgi:uncharacterized membrane protein
LDNVILVSFSDATGTYRALDELRRLDEEGAVAVQAAAVVERREDGSFRVAENAASLGLAGSVAGGIIGALIGALAGPLGLLVGGVGGVAVGSATDAAEAQRADALVSTVAKSVPRGATALVVDVEERAMELLDSAMASCGGIVVRWSRADVGAALALGADASAASEETSPVDGERRSGE